MVTIKFGDRVKVFVLLKIIIYYIQSSSESTKVIHQIPVCED